MKQVALLTIGSPTASVHTVETIEDAWQAKIDGMKENGWRENGGVSATLTGKVQWLHKGRGKDTKKISVGYQLVPVNG